MSVKTIFILVALLLPLLVFAAQPINEIDLLWEAETYTPLFYLGHPAAAPQSTVRVVALPNFVSANGKKYKESELVFEWVKDLKNIGSHSGPGQNVLTYTAEASGTNRVSVTVSTRDGSLRQEKTITVEPTAPRLVLYEDDPLIGIAYHRAVLPEFFLEQPEISLVAEPFFFDRTAAEEQKLDYDWRLNDKKIISHPDNQRLITLTAPEQGQGTNIISVAAKNVKNILQSARKNLVIKFGSGFNF